MYPQLGGAGKEEVLSRPSRVDGFGVAGIWCSPPHDTTDGLKGWNNKRESYSMHARRRGMLWFPVVG